MSYLGSTVTAEIDEATRECKTKAEADRAAQQVLERWFGDPKKPQPGQFADPALLITQ